MSSDSKYFSNDAVINVDMKEQAIAHWEENLKRVEAMNWRRWNRLKGSMRSDIVFSTVGDRYPHIGGDECPYCKRYNWSCRTADGTELCPLKQGFIPGECCVAWLRVREALTIPWSKELAIIAIKGMIEYIKEKG